ncbi:MAG: alpha/beta hydrolase, partial [Acidimicrobiia bacterium]
MSGADRRNGLMLIHGGLYEPIGPSEFWHQPGIVVGLEEAGWRVVAPARLTAPSSWTEEVEHIFALVPFDPVRWSVMAGSNGCSVAVRLAVDNQGLVDRLVLCWPATAGDPDVDQRQLAPAEMLRGETLRGVNDTELA